MANTTRQDVDSRQVESALEEALGWAPTRISDETLTAIRDAVIMSSGNGEFAEWLVGWVQDTPQRHQRIRDLFKKQQERVELAEALAIQRGQDAQQHIPSCESHVEGDCDCAQRIPIAKVQEMLIEYEGTGACDCDGCRAQDKRTTNRFLKEHGYEVSDDG